MSDAGEVDAIQGLTAMSDHVDMISLTQLPGYFEQNWSTDISYGGDLQLTWCTVGARWGRSWYLWRPCDGNKSISLLSIDNITSTHWKWCFIWVTNGNGMSKMNVVSSQSTRGGQKNDNFKVPSILVIQKLEMDFSSNQNRTSKYVGRILVIIVNITG